MATLQKLALSSKSWSHFGTTLSSRGANKKPQAMPGRVAQSAGHLMRKSGVVGSIPGLATSFRFSFRFFKRDSCQLLAKVCA